MHNATNLAAQVANLEHRNKELQQSFNRMQDRAERNHNTINIEQASKLKMLNGLKLLCANVGVSTVPDHPLAIEELHTALLLRLTKHLAGGV